MSYGTGGSHYGSGSGTGTGTGSSSGAASSSSFSAPSSTLASRSTVRVTKVERVLFQSNQAPRDPKNEPARTVAALELSRHHFILRFSAPTESTLQIPYTLINTLARLPSLPTHERHVRIYPLGLRLRTFEIYALGFDSEALATDVFETVKAYAVLRSPEQLYAFYRQPRQETSSSSSPAANGWRFYDPRREFARQGVGSRTKAWRFTDLNNTYSFSSTYPSQLVVPTRISDQTLTHAAKYRSKARIPALTYLHWANYGSITRCSQPLVGLRNNRSAQDEKLVEAIFSSHIFADPDSRAAQAAAAASAAASQNGGVAALGPSAGMVIYGATSTNLIIDARPTTNAMANVAKGAGSENMEHYRGCKKAYLGIDNIHVMRDSLNRLTDALKDAAQPVSFSISSGQGETSGSLLDRAGTLNGPGRSAAAANGSLYATYRPGRPGSSQSTPQPPKPLDTVALKRSNWLKHIAALLEGTMMIVRNVHINSSHALIHCSDGWDRTSQLAALAQICLDPYFRTIDGFAVLVEKDWLSFGHRFEDRSGHLGHPNRFVTDPGHGEPPAGEDWESDGEGGGAGGQGDSEGFEPQAAVNALWGFTKQLTANFAGAAGGGSSGSSSAATNPKEISPVFHQFLDCVWQVMRQFPTRFEYNAAFLIELHAQAYSCEYGTFLLNSERERNALGTDDGKVVKLQDKTPSLWDDLLGSDEQRKRWRNNKYDPSQDVPPSSTSTSSPQEGILKSTSASASPTDEKTEASATNLPSPTAILVSDGSAPEPSSKPSRFGDMGVLMANPRELRFFAKLFRRDQQEMNALIVAEAQERARYAQRLADAAANASAARAAAAQAQAQAEAGAVPVPRAIAVEAGSLDPGRDPAAAAALASSGSAANSGRPVSNSGGGGGGAGSPADGRAGAIDLGTTPSASRLDTARLAYQPRIARPPAATMPRSASGASLGAGRPGPSRPAAVGAGPPGAGSGASASASAGAGGEMGLDEAGARMKDLFIGGWGRLQNAIASAGQAAAAATAPAPVHSPASQLPQTGTSATWQHPLPDGAAPRRSGTGASAGSANPWATAGAPALGRSGEDVRGQGRSGARNTEGGTELGGVPAGRRGPSPTPQAPPPLPEKPRQPAYLQSATLTNNPWAAAAAPDYPPGRNGPSSRARLEDVFGAEQARPRQSGAGAGPAPPALSQVESASGAGSDAAEGGDEASFDPLGVGTV